MNGNGDKLLIENGKLTVLSAEGKNFEGTEADFQDFIRDDVVPPIGDAALPDGSKFFKWEPPFLCVVHQLPAHVRQVRWIASDSPTPFGPGVKFAKREISLPYAITFAIYCRMQTGLALIHRDELYFRNEPLKTRTDRLGYPALSNVSKIANHRRVRSWICTQYLRTDSSLNWAQQLGRLIDHTWDGGFNLSSEHHEGASWYGESEGIHPDLHPIERWVEATKKDAFFACKVDWKPVALNVGQIEDAMLEECRGYPGFGSRRRPSRSTSFLGRLINSLQKREESSMKPIPIYLKKERNAPRLTDPEFYWVTGNGFFFCRNHPFFASDVPAPQPPKHLDSHHPSCQVRFPRLRVSALEFVVGFFDRVYRTHGSESIVLVYWDPSRKRYKLHVPKQEATVWESSSGHRTPLNVIYTVPVDLPANLLLVADLHCHCDFGAGASLMDERDEKHRDGAHVIVGRIDREPPEFNIILAVDGFRFRMQLQQLAAGYAKRRHIIPQRWLDQVTVKVDRPRSTWSEARSGQKQGWTKTTHGFNGKRGGDKA